MHIVSLRFSDISYTYNFTIFFVSSFSHGFTLFYQLLTFWKVSLSFTYFLGKIVLPHFSDCFHFFHGIFYVLLLFTYLKILNIFFWISVVYNLSLFYFLWQFVSLIFAYILHSATLLYYFLFSSFLFFILYLV